MINKTKNDIHESINPKRKLNDIWALIFYTLSLIIILGFGVSYLLNFKSANNFLLINKFLEKQFIFSFLFNFIYFLIFSILTLLLCRFIPTILIYISFFSLVLGTLYSMFFLKNNPLLLIFNFLYLVGLIFFFYFGIYQNIDYISSLLTSTAFIISKFYLEIFSVLFVTILFNAIIIFMILILLSKSDSVPIIGTLCILFLFWSIFITSYVMNVFTASTVFNYIITNENLNRFMIFRKSIINTTYALGSICFAAFIIAVVKVLQYIVKNHENNRRNNRRDRGMMSQIFYVIFSYLLSILIDIIGHMNNLVFPYLAIYGTSYKQSIINSYQSITNNGTKKLAAKQSITYVTWFCTLFFTVLVTFLNLLYFSKDNLFDIFNNSKETIICFSLSIFLFLKLYYDLISSLNTAVLTLIFMNIKFSKELKNYNSNINDIFEKMK